MHKKCTPQRTLPIILRSHYKYLNYTIFNTQFFNIFSKISTSFVPNLLRDLKDTKVPISSSKITIPTPLSNHSTIRFLIISQNFFKNICKSHSLCIIFAKIIHYGYKLIHKSNSRSSAIAFTIKP